MKKSSNLIKHGDIFKLGNHYLACGDSRDAKLIEMLANGMKVKAVVIDPPYGVAVTESKENFQALLKNKVVINDHLQSDEEYRVFTRQWINAIKPHLERKNTFHIFNADKMIFALREGMLDSGLKFCQLLIWVKTHAVIGRMDYAPQHELIAYGWFGTHEFLKPKDKSVLIYPKPQKSPLHPTTKPIALIRHLVLNATRLGDVVFDGFLGSGTTLIACEQTKRVCLGVEWDPEYIETAIMQFEKLTGVKAIKIYGK